MVITKKYYFLVEKNANNIVLFAVVKQVEDILTGLWISYEALDLRSASKKSPVPSMTAMYLIKIVLWFYAQFIYFKWVTVSVDCSTYPKTMMLVENCKVSYILVSEKLRLLILLLRPIALINTVSFSFKL